MYDMSKTVAMANPREDPEPKYFIYEPLSPREQEILMLLIADGPPNREIAMQLCISENTVKTHLRQIFGKLGARNRTEAVAIAHRNGLLTIS